MVFLRLPFAHELPPVLHGRGVQLRTPTVSDFAQWALLRTESRDFLTPWEPLWPANDLTRPAFRARIKRYWQDIDNDLGYPFFIWSEDGASLLGAVSLSNVRRGVAQTATLGYWIGQLHARQGHMTAAVAALLPFAYGQLGLHRVEAACLPTNEASIRLLEKSGFEREGFARRYLKINGDWRDHLLFARLAPWP
jgi:ribosomal-protein-alanine N-acetyltransferase